ncbi:metallophosphoesterase [Nodosilinea sp. P-1105]|uniref:metallophosphoesterase family protein n=1 Tax=Nodosilinea sp. P-1105 TaxID=2546229 RepID=UPI00146E4F30|nr:metallophosphoesterase [Nodosilinea sp. P-1105]NMF85670.1 metallophosphoesterase [Nodosilinea sp. P-1105]
MGQRFRFAIISDPHIARPETIYNGPYRFHLVEVSIPGIEQIFAQLETLDLDFLLLPGDLTQHGEWANHEWLIERLAKLPFPTYVVPGNHDVIARDASDRAIGLQDFPRLYQDHGYSDGQTLHYHHQILPGVRLIGLNSNAFKPNGEQIGVGHIDQAQLDWLEAALAQTGDDLVLVMLHHNVLEHLPGQSQSPMGQRYMVDNNQALIQRLQAAGVRLMFTGHLHVQDIARQGELCEVLTGSIVSYPHPYRLVEVEWGEAGLRVEVRSHRLTAVDPWPDLQGMSYQWMCDRSQGFMTKFLTSPPLNLSQAEAEAAAPHLRNFWCTIAAGDPQFDFAALPPHVGQVLAPFNAVDADGQPQSLDNHATLLWPST